MSSIVVLNLVDNMAGEGYPAESILATLRSQAEAELREEDLFWSAEDEAAERKRIAAIVEQCNGSLPF